MVKSEIRSLTGIRGLAAFFVCIHHFYYYYYTTSNKTSVFCNNKYWYTFLSHGYLAVDVFFMLSAFVITLSSGKLFEGEFKLANYKFFMQKRWLRVYPAYFIVLVAGFVFSLHFHYAANFLLSLTLLNFAFGIRTLFGHLWSISVEWITYLLYPLFVKFSGVISPGVRKYVLIALGFAIIYINGAIFKKGYFVADMLNEYLTYPGLIRCFGDYLVGMGIYNIYIKRKAGILFSNGASILISLLLIGSLFLPIDVVTVFLSMLLILSISTDSNIVASFLSSKAIYFMGIISYPLYLIHYLIFEQLARISLFLNTHFHPAKSYLTVLIVFVMGCITIATLFTYLLEWPVIKYLNKGIRDRQHA